MKKAVLIHGWEGYPEEGWRPWLKEKLEANGFQVFVPALLAVTAETVFFYLD